jgi:hypothetical protein
MACRWLIAVVFASWVFAPTAPAQSVGDGSIDGVYNGSYEGPEGTTPFTLALTVQEGRGNLVGVFTSHPAGNSDVVVSTTDLAGFYRGANHRFQLRIKNARTVPLSQGAMLGINGAFDPASGQLSGMIVIFGTTPAKFEAARGGMESAKMGGATTETPKTTPPVRQTAAPAQAAVTTIDGVYNGTYICGQGTTDLKLSLEGSPRGNISALFTFYLPPGTQQHGYTYSLRGRYNPQTSKFSLTPVQWETEHPDNFGMVGMNGTASASGLDGNITGGACRTFHVERNEGESANIAAVIAAQKSVGPPVSAPPPEEERYAAAPQAKAPASARSASPAQLPPPQPPVSQSQPPPAVSAPAARPPDSVRQATRKRPDAAPAPAAAPEAPSVQQAALQRPDATPAPAVAPPASSARCYFCFTTDPTDPLVYFSGIFDVPDAGGVADKFLQYMQIKIEFRKYLLEKYKYYPSSDDPVNCLYADVEPGQAKSPAEAVAGKKQSAEADVATSKRQIVETDWKYTGATDTAASTTTPASQPVAPPAPAPASGEQASDDDTLGDKVIAKLSGPVAEWHMVSKTDPLTDEVTTQPTATKFILDAGLVVTLTAYCGNNGVSVFFLVAASSNQPPPQFGWYTDDSDNSGDQVADVRMRVDGGEVHVAHGYPNKEGHTEYSNWLGLLFYEPGFVAHVAQNQEDSVNTGILAFDRFVAPLVRDQANANAQGWAANSAGPLSNLVNAKSIRIELPLLNQSSPRIVELNPQDKVLHKFVSDCYAGFTPRSQPAPAAPTENRQRYSR